MQPVGVGYVNRPKKAQNGVGEEEEEEEEEEELPAIGARPLLAVDVVRVYAY